MDALTAARTTSMSPARWLIIAVCTLCNMIDGFDFFVMGFVLPHLDESFASAAVKGFLISAGLIGMGLGAMFLAPLADRYGRRAVILTGLAVNVVGMAASALAPNATVLLAARLLTGLGVGMVSVLIMVVAQEYASVARRNLAIGIVTIGFPLGSTVAGLVGVSLLGLFGGAWQGLFWSGVLISVVALVITAALLPESLAYLFARGAASRERIAAVSTRLGLDADPDARPAPEPTAGAASGGGGILSAALRQRTILLWVLYFGLLAAFYFVSTWTPQLIAKTTGDVGQGAVAGTILSVGSLAGSIVFGLVGLKVLATRVAWVALALSVLSVLGFAVFIRSGAALALAALLGLAIYTATAAITAMAPPMYPARLRATGYGWMLGLGRIGGILAPIAAGFALAVMSPQAMYAAAAVPLAVAAVAAFWLYRATRAQFVGEWEDAARRAGAVRGTATEEAAEWTR